MRHRRFLMFSTALILWGALFLSAGMPPGIDQTAAREREAAGNARLIEALKSYIPHMIQQTGVWGLNIALARRGDVIWEEGFGWADVEKKIPMTKDTVFHSGSMGKTYTATAVMQLVDKGLIGLHDPINKYLKEFQVKNPLGDRDITFHDLLTHRSGLATNNAGCRFVTTTPLGRHLKEQYSKKMDKIYNETVVPTWSAKVGEKYQYSNFGMATLGYLVEVINPEGLSYSEYVQKYIMDPLGMKSSQYPPIQDAAHVRPDIFARFSTGYAKFGQVDIPTPTIYFDDFPAGTVVSTPGDHIRLILAYLNQGRYRGYQLLKPETVKLMLTPQVPLGNQALGLVWHLTNVDKPDFSFGHAGAHMFGWYNNFRAYPKPNFALVVAVNSWDMTSAAFGNKEFNLLANFISTWIEHEEENVKRTSPSTSWAWKTSYVIGLIMAERLRGGLGIEEPLTPEMIEAMARGAKVRAGGEGKGILTWDPDGFRAGIKDMIAVEMTFEGIKGFLKSDRLKITSQELEIITKELGSDKPLLPWISY